MLAPLWQPDPDRIMASNMLRFMQSTNHKYNLQLQTYEDLHHWSITHPDKFWSDWWDYARIIAHSKGDTILKDGALMSRARWFPAGKLNYAENLLKFRDQHTALLFYREDGAQQNPSYAIL